MTDVFKSFPFTPPAYPTKDYHVCNKKYCDSVYLPCTSVYITNGISSVGFSVGDVNSLLDGKVMRVSESAGTPGFDIRFYFDDVKRIDYVFIRSSYEGSNIHYVDIDIYNNTNAAWDKVGTVLHAATGSYRNIEIPIPDDTAYISNKAAQVRIYHATTGTANHFIYCDYAALKGKGNP